MEGAQLSSVAPLAPEARGNRSVERGGCAGSSLINPPSVPQLKRLFEGSWRQLQQRPSQALPRRGASPLQAGFSTNINAVLLLIFISPIPFSAHLNEEISFKNGGRDQRSPSIQAGMLPNQKPV